jgi:hypothetical protein
MKGAGRIGVRENVITGGKRTLGRPRLIWVDDIKANLKKKG